MKTLKQFQENTRAYKEYTRLSGVTPEQRAQQMDDVSAKIEQQRRDFERDMAAQKAKMSALKNKHHTQDHMKEEVEELDEALRHEIAGQVARFIGNKIDPVHGDIMHAHGKEAYRQAAYHIRNTIHHVSRAISDLHDQLHQHLKTSNPIKLKLGEEVELDEARYSKYKQDTYTRPNMTDNYADFAHLGMNSDVPASKSEFKKKELKFELRKEPKKVKEEASPMIKAPKNEFATKADAFAHAKEKGGKVMKKTFTHPTTGQQHISYVVKEEVEQIDEAQLLTVIRQKDGTHHVNVKTETGEIKHIGTIHPPDSEGVRVAKYKDGTKVALSKNMDDLAKDFLGITANICVKKLNSMKSRCIIPWCIKQQRKS